MKRAARIFNSVFVPEKTATRMIMKTYWIYKISMDGRRNNINVMAMAKLHCGDSQSVINYIKIYQKMPWHGCSPRRRKEDLHITKYKSIRYRGTGCLKFNAILVIKRQSQGDLLTLTRGGCSAIKATSTTTAITTSMYCIHGNAQVVSNSPKIFLREFLSTWL